MKILTSQQVKQLDQYTIAHEPISAINLMERAAAQCTQWLVKHFERKYSFKIFCGSGNNGADGFAIARQLAVFDYKVCVYYVKSSSTPSVETIEQRNRLLLQGGVEINDITDPNEFPQINTTHIVIDAMMGSGLQRPLEGLIEQCVNYLNHCQCVKIAIDIPTGLFAEHNIYPVVAFMAQHTLTFQTPFLSFLFAENEPYVGQWHVLPIGLHNKKLNETNSIYHVIEANNIKLLNRIKFGHKGTFGHALMFAGSYGMVGCAVLASKACLRGGCGLLTTHIPRFACNILQTAVPEAILSIDMQDTHITEAPNLSNYNAIGIGSGIGKLPETAKLLKQLLTTSSKPLVIDADALNILANNPEWLRLIPQKSILTPHPLEFDRIAGLSGNSYERLQKAIDLAKQLNIYIVLKGAYTCIVEPTGYCSFNTTGNAGMATAGSGDVLAGIILSLLAQGYEPVKAAIVGVYIHGLAGNLAVEQIGQHALIASDIIEYLGKAFITLEHNNV